MRVIYVDDETPALQNFRLTAATIKKIDDLKLFQLGKEAIQYIKENHIDVAFLDIEMQGENGIDIARDIKNINENIKIIFVTAYKEYALDAFGVDAIDYIMKPYLKEDIERALTKASRYSSYKSKKRIEIQTIPNFSVSIEGKPFHIRREKALELFAFLVENGERGITTNEGISCLWPDRSNDSNAQALFRMTYKRLMDALDNVGAGDIIVTENNRRFIRTDMIHCDLYDILNGDKEVARKYNGRYLEEYSWAEERNGQLMRIIFENI